MFVLRKKLPKGAFLNIGLHKPAGDDEPKFLHPSLTNYQQEFLDNFKKYNLLLWGRRAGKDTIAFFKMVQEALKKPGKYYYIFPGMRTGKSIVTGVSDELSGLSKIIPPKKVKKVYRSGGSTILLTNGSTISLIGVGSSQQNRALRGDDISGVILSEYAYYSRPEAVFSAIAPALTRTNGWLIFASTPYANSHLVELYENKQGQDNWFVSKVTQRDDKYLTDEQFDSISQGMSKTAIDAEFNCEYNIPNAHSVFYDQLQDTVCKEKSLKYQNTPVYVGMDLGITDSDTVFWWVTIINDMLFFFDYFQGSSKPFEHYVKLLLRKPYKYEKIFVPHDIVNREFFTLRSRMDMLRETELPLQLLPKEKIMDSIDRVRFVFERKTYFFTQECVNGLQHLKSYSYRDAFNAIPDVKSKHSHAVDAMRYLVDGLTLTQKI